MIITCTELTDFICGSYGMEICEAYPNLLRIYHRESKQMLYIRKRKRYFGLMIRLHFFTIKDAFAPMTPRIAYAQLRLHIQVNRNTTKHR